MTLVMTKTELLALADEKPNSINDDLYAWATQAAAALREYAATMDAEREQTTDEWYSEQYGKAPAPTTQEPVATHDVGSGGYSVLDCPHCLRTIHIKTVHPPAPQRTPWPIRGVRVEGGTVIITVKGGNDAARWLCGEVLAEHGENK